MSNVFFVQRQKIIFIDLQNGIWFMLLDSRTFFHLLFKFFRILKRTKIPSGSKNLATVPQLCS